MRRYLKQILSLIGFVFYTNSPVSAQHFTKDNNNFLEIVLLDKYPVDDDFNSVILYGDKVNNNVTNSLEYGGKKYSLNANEKINTKNRIVVDGTVFLEIQNLNAQNTKKCWTDVVLYDIPVLNNVSRLNKKYEIVRNFIHKEKLYRIKAINKDIWDKYSSQCFSSILDNLYLIHEYFYNGNENHIN